MAVSNWMHIRDELPPRLLVESAVRPLVSRLEHAKGSDPGEWLRLGKRIARRALDRESRVSRCSLGGRFFGLRRTI